MTTVITVVQVVACVFLILVVLVQSGKGADISASLGGSSQTVFGSAGGANFFTRLTAVLAAIFMVTAIYLTHANSRQARTSIMDVPTPAGSTGSSGKPAAAVPAIPAKAAPGSSAAAPVQTAPAKSAPTKAVATPAAPATPTKK